MKSNEKDERQTNLYKGQKGAVSIPRDDLIPSIRHSTKA